MPRPAALLVALAAFLTALPTAWAAGHRTSFALPTGAKVQVAALVDGFTVGLHVDGLEARQLERALLHLRAESVQILASRGDKTLAYVRFAEHVVAAEARLGHGHGHGQRQRQRRVQVHLHVTTESPRNAMLAHVMDLPLPVPKTLETQALANADQAFVHKQLAEAELRLKRLQDRGLQRAWVMVRLGDLAVFRNRLEDACALYAEAQIDGAMRTASTLAALRGRVLGCHEKRRQTKKPLGHDANPGHLVDWATLLRRYGRDDPIGRRMAQEARWALAYERDARVLEGVLELEGPVFARHVDPPLRAALLARLLRQSSPYALAVTAKRSATWRTHPEAFDLALQFGLAWCALDVPSAWNRPAASAKSWLQLTPRERTRLVQEVSACAVEQTPKAAADAVQVASLKPARHLARLRERLQQVQQAALPRTEERAASVVEAARSSTTQN